MNGNHGNKPVVCRLPSTVCLKRRVLDDLTSAWVYEMHSGHRTIPEVRETLALVSLLVHSKVLLFYRVVTMVKFLKVRYRSVAVWGLSRLDGGRFVGYGPIRACAAAPNHPRHSSVFPRSVGAFVACLYCCGCIWCGGVGEGGSGGGRAGRDLEGIWRL